MLEIRPNGYGNAILSLTYTRTATLHEILILFIEAVAFIICNLTLPKLIIISHYDATTS
jgi:hypothetical protein